MFLVIPANATDRVLVFEDPRTDQPGFAGDVIEGVTLERMDCTAAWPYGFSPPEGSELGQDPANPKRFKVFESERIRNEGRYLKPEAEQRGPYRSFSEYLRERGRKAV